MFLSLKKKKSRYFLWLLLIWSTHMLMYVPWKLSHQRFHLVYLLLYFHRSWIKMLRSFYIKVVTINEKTEYHPQKKQSSCITKISILYTPGSHLPKHPSVMHHTSVMHHPYDRASKIEGIRFQIKGYISVHAAKNHLT